MLSDKQQIPGPTDVSTNSPPYQNIQPTSAICREKQTQSPMRCRGALSILSNSVLIFMQWPRLKTLTTMYEASETIRLHVCSSNRFHSMRKYPVKKSIHCPIVSLPFPQSAFHTINNLSHPGVRVTKPLMSTKFVWRGMTADVAKCARACIPYQQAKVFRHVRATQNPTKRFEHIHVDMVGPLPTCRRFKHILTIIDRYTRCWS